MTLFPATPVPPILERPSSTRFVCRVREAGHRRWQVLDGENEKLEQAIERLAHVFAAGSFTHGEVLLTADYYEPYVVIKMVKR